MTGNNRTVTLGDLAQQVGVSTKTVSLALRKSPGVSDYIKNKVAEAAKELNYSPSSNRRRATQRKLTLGVCIPDLAEHYGELAQEIIRYAGTLNYAVIPQITNDNIADELRAVQMFKRLGVAAVIMTSSRIGEAAVRELEEDGILVVAIVSTQPNLGGPLPYFKLPLLIDHYESTYKATKHLTELGHNRIAYLAGPRNSSSNVAKCGGFKKALEDVGVTVDDKYIVEYDTGRYDCSTGYEECLELIERSEVDKPSALVCYNDELALGALACLISNHIEVPTEMSIVGNDDIKHARYWRPPLTTVSIPRQQLAQEAIGMIDDCIHNPKKDIDMNFKIVPKLIIRGSTGRCASSK